MAPPVTFWAPNQAATAQVETVTAVGAPTTGNTLSATLNGKTITYTALSTDTTAALFATGLFNLLNASGVPAEFNEITWANSSAGVITATAKVAGTPFANVPGTSAGLVFSSGNGYTGTFTQVHTTANTSPSDVNDAQNWLRVITPAPGVRSLPKNGDDVIVDNSSVPLLWNLDQLASVQFNTYTRYQSFTGTIGLPENNPLGYTEWRATYFKFVGPQGSVPAGGLVMILGQGTGSGPTRERYNVGSQPVTLTILAMGSPADTFGVRFLGVHTANTFTILSGSLGVATGAGEVANLSSCTIAGSASVNIGQGVTWTAASTLTLDGGSVVLNAAPATLQVNNGGKVSVTKDGLTWTTVTAQGNSSLQWLAGGTITTLTLTTGSSLDKSGDARALTLTNSTIDGDSCFINDPNNAITWTNGTLVKQSVTQGPIRFTGQRFLTPL